MDQRIAIAPCHGRSIGDHAGIASQPQRSALVDLIALTGHKINDLMYSFGGKFTRVCICDTQYMTGVFDHGDLHSEADTKIRDVVFPRILCRQNHAFDTAVTEAAGDNDTVQIGKDMIFRFLCDGLGVNPLNVDHGVKRKTCMAQSLGYGEIGVVELYILAYKSDGDCFAAAFDGCDHGLPLAQIRLRGGQMQFPADNGGKLRLFQKQRRFIEYRKGQVFDNTVRLHIAEVGNFTEDALVCDGFITAQDDDIGCDAHALQLLHGVLGGL